MLTSSHAKLKIKHAVIYVYNYFLLLPVKTKGLKIAAQLQKGASGGVIEWKVN